MSELKTTAGPSTRTRSVRRVLAQDDNSLGVSQEFGEAVAGDVLLRAAGEFLHREFAGLHLVLADDDDEARAGLFCGLEGLLQAESLVAEVGADARAAEFAREFERVRIHAFT